MLISPDPERDPFFAGYALFVILATMGLILFGIITIGMENL